MKKLALFLAVVLLFGLCTSGCGGAGGEHDDMIEEAIEVLEEHWADTYDEMENSRDGERHFEIKNTRVITLKKNEYEELEDIEYIVDFALYIDYYGETEYYVEAPSGGPWFGGAVAVYRDGDMEVVSNRLVLDAMSDLTAIKPPENPVKKIDDYGDAYNCDKTLD